MSKMSEKPRKNRQKYRKKVKNVLNGKKTPSKSRKNSSKYRKTEKKRQKIL